MCDQGSSTHLCFDGRVVGHSENGRNVGARVIAFLPRNLLTTFAMDRRDELPSMLIAWPSKRNVQRARSVISRFRPTLPGGPTQPRR